jgi:hypothetical protein
MKKSARIVAIVLALLFVLTAVISIVAMFLR